MNRALSDAELLARLVAFDTTSRNSNLPIADFICDYLDDPRVEVIRNFSDDQTKVNLVMRLAPRDAAERNRDERSGLVLSGHLDVVPAEEPDWKSDPFVLVETEQAYIGRGACDMKGFVALAINTMHRATSAAIRNPLVLVLTFDEEPGTLGAQHLARTWPNPFALPVSAIIGEPTSLRVVRMHKGHTKLRVTVRGRAAHSGYPHLGENAIEPMGRIITALSEVRRRWEAQRGEGSAYFPETPFVALNVGTVRGGSAVNVIPESCTMEFGFRPMPGMNSRALMDEVRDVILNDEAAERITVECLGDSPPLLTPESSRVYQTLCGSVEQKESIGVSYASDAGPLSTMGLEGVVWGPGTIEVAHKANESMPKAELARARVLLDKVVQTFCG